MCYSFLSIHDQQSRWEQQMKKCIDHIRGMEAKKTLKCHENLSSHEQLKKERSRCQTFENRVLNAESANATCIDFVASSAS
jgi:hypothetical protein